MRTTLRAGLGALAFSALIGGLAAQAQTPAPAAPTGNGHPTTVAWVFKPKAAPYLGPNKPVWHVAEILAAHKGKADWTQAVLRDPWFQIDYVSMGPGKTKPLSFRADTVTWFIVYSGQVKVSIKGQEPVVATKDFMVQVPARTPYTLETVGDVPSVRFHVEVTGDTSVYPVAENPTAPTPPPGYEAVKVVYGAPGSASNAAPPKSFLDYQKEVINAPPRPPGAAGGGGNFFVRDARAFAVPIRSAPTKVADDDIGHFHSDVAEFWYILEGDMDTRIEGEGVVKGHYGDLVYAPAGRFHRTIMVGAPFSVRVASGSITDSGASFMPYKGQ